MRKPSLGAIQILDGRLRNFPLMNFGTKSWYDGANHNQLENSPPHRHIMVAYVYARGSAFEDVVNRYMTTGVPIIPSDPMRGMIGGNRPGNGYSLDVAGN